MLNRFYEIWLNRSIPTNPQAIFKNVKETNGKVLYECLKSYPREKAKFDYCLKRIKTGAEEKLRPWEMDDINFAALLYISNFIKNFSLEDVLKFFTDWQSRRSILIKRYLFGPVLLILLSQFCGADIKTLGFDLESVTHPHNLILFLIIYIIVLSVIYVISIGADLRIRMVKLSKIGSLTLVMPITDLIYTFLSKRPPHNVSNILLLIPSGTLIDLEERATIEEGYLSLLVFRENLEGYERGLWFLDVLEVLVILLGAYICLVGLIPQYFELYQPTWINTLIMYFENITSI